LPGDDSAEALINNRLSPDPARARVRVYSTQSTHKTLTSLRQGSMIHVYDQDFALKVAESFREAYMSHTSTSPNYQILASLDLGRRQAALEGFERVQRQLEYAMKLRDAIDHHPLLSKYMHCLSRVSATFVTPIPRASPCWCPGRWSVTRDLVIHAQPRYPGDPWLRGEARLPRLHVQGVGNDR
jgi:hypothetical protein